MKAHARQPRCIVIAGPNGAGKTTFARQFLPKGEGVTYFVNADLIASGISPLSPGLAAVATGRIFLAELDRWARAREDFAFKTTLSGQMHLSRLNVGNPPATGLRLPFEHLLRLRLQFAALQNA